MKYKKIGAFADYKQELIDNKEDFILEETTYTKKIVTDYESIIFNDSGEQDFEMLALINRVRNDSKEYYGIIRNTNVDYFDLVKPPPKGVICKIDIRGAYWSYAINKGIISNETNEYLKDNFTGTTRMKNARLKALGSLATKKNYYYYEKGELKEHKFKKQGTTDLYVEVCRGIDELMMEITANFSGAFFYYWDCIFTEKEYEKDIVEYLRRKGYSSTVKDTSIEVIRVGNRKYLLSVEDEKMYIVRKEQEYLLTQNKLR